MINRFFLFLLVLTFSQTAFSQTAATENPPKAYLFGGNNVTASVSTRAQIYKSESAKPAGKSTAATAFDIERRAFDLINQLREMINLESLTWSDDAAKIARLHSESMANHNFFSHTGLDGSSVSDRADFFGVKKWQAIGENIAYNQGFENPVEFAVERWMQSPKHRDNLLNSRWKESGIGIAVTAGGTYYFTEVFLARN
jgi:uncharacterized protein YkwD